MSGCCQYSAANAYVSECQNPNCRCVDCQCGSDCHCGIDDSNSGTCLNPLCTCDDCKCGSNCRCSASAPCVKKPLSEWKKLEPKKCDNAKWVPLNQKGKVAACNPVQLSNLQRMRDSIEGGARKHNATAISWDQFNGGSLGSYSEAEQLTAQTANKGSFVTLRQADFSQGTVRIRAGGYFKLAENIVFEPNSTVVDPIQRYTPTAAQRLSGALYADDAYVRDFFTALTIEAEDVYLDLNGFSMSVSALFQAAQRFTSVVELADQPFPPMQGPGNFGASVAAARNAVVANGTIRLSSHHGIHGNNCSNILLENLTFRDYEFAGIAINWGMNCVVYKCKLLGTLQSLKFNARLSAAMFGLRDAAKLLSIAVSTGTSTTGDPMTFGTPANVYNLVQGYYNDLAAIVTPIINTGNIAADHPLASKVCTLSDGRQVNLIDGGAYGIMFNNFGVAVNGFDEDATSSSNVLSDAREILICSTKVYNTFANFDEVPAYFDTRTATKGHQVDTTGQLVNLSLYFDCINNRFDLSGAGENKELVRLQLGNVWLRKQIAAVSPATDLSLFKVGRVADELFPLLSPSPVVPCSSLTDFVWKRNGDAMFHVGKGSMGIRLDGISQVCIRDVLIDGVENCGSKAIVCPLPCETDDFQIDLDVPPNCCPLNMSGTNFDALKRSGYTGPTDGGHPMQGKNIIGYGGNDAYGITCSALSHFDFSNVQIKSVVSHYGSAVGTLIQCQSNDGKMTCTTIEKVLAASDANQVDFSQGVKAPIANGIRIDTSSTNISIEKPDISNVVATGYAACRMCINSNGVNVST